MIFLWICYNLCVYLSLVSFICVAMFICICEKIQMYVIQIYCNIHMVFSKEAQEYKLVYQFIWVFSQNLGRGLP